MNSNTNQQPISNDGSAHHQSLGQKVANMIPGNKNSNSNTYSNDNASNQAGFNSNTTTGAYGSTNPNSGYTDSHTQYGADGGLGSNRSGSNHNSGTHSSNTTGADHGSNTSSNNGQQQYMSKDGDLHNSKMAAEIDDMTPGSNSNRNTNNNAGYSSQSGVASNNSTGLASHSNTNSGYGAGNNGSQTSQNVSNDGDVHKSALGAKLDNVTPSRNDNQSNLNNSNINSNSNYGSSDADAHRNLTGSQYGAQQNAGIPAANNYGAGDTSQNYASSHVGNNHGNQTATSLDNTSGSNNAGYAAGPAGGLHNAAPGHSSSTTHPANSNEKVGLMDKMKGKAESLTGKLTGNHAKAEHGEQVATGNANTNSRPM